MYVGNLSWKTSSHELKEHVEAIAPVVKAVVLMEPDGMLSNGRGIVEFQTAEDAQQAMLQHMLQSYSAPATSHQK